MKKIRTVLQLAAFAITLPVLVLSETNHPPMQHQVEKESPVIEATAFHKESVVSIQDESAPVLLNSQIIVINY